MTSLRGIVVVGLAVGLLTSALPLVAPASDNLPMAVRTSKSKPKVVRRSGHELVSVSKLEEMQEGTFKIHQVLNHLVYAKLVKSKVVSLQVRTPEGKLVVMKASSTEQIESTTKKRKKPAPSKETDGDKVFFSFKSRTLKLSIHFPGTSCDESVLSVERTEKSERDDR